MQHTVLFDLRIAYNDRELWHVLLMPAVETLLPPSLIFQLACYQVVPCLRAVCDSSTSVVVVWPKGAS
jgi:hypothetical protein